MERCRIYHAQNIVERNVEKVCIQKIYNDYTEKEYEKLNVI